MKGIKVILLSALLLPQITLGANISDDQLVIGDPSTTSNKSILFRGQGRSLESSFTSQELSWNGSLLKLGNGTAANQRITFDIGLGSSNPFLQWNNADKRFKQSLDGSTIRDLGTGSGSGGGENYNNAFGPDDNPNGESTIFPWSGNSFSINTTDPLEGEGSFYWDAPNPNATIAGPSVNLDRDIFRNQACQASFVYVGSFGDQISVRIRNDASEILALEKIKYSELASVHTTFFRCPSAAEISENPLRANVYLDLVKDPVSGPVPIKYDKLYIGTLTGLSEVTTPDMFGAFIVSTGSNTRNYGGIISSSSNTSTGIYTINFQGLSVTPVCSVTRSAGSTQSQSCYITDGTESSSSIGVHCRTGETFFNTNFTLNCHKGPVDAKQSVQVYKSIPRVADNVNEFSAYISSTGGVSRMPVPFINSCTSSVVGRWTCSFLTGTFSDSPVCQLTANSTENANDQVAKTNTAPNVTDISVITTSNGAYFNTGFYITCNRGGSDFRMPTVQPIVIGQVMNSAASAGPSNVRVESCRVNNNGTATIDNTSGLCSSWISSASRGSTGVLNVNIIPGTFSSQPRCFGSGEGTDPVFYAARGITATTIQIRSRSQPGTYFDSDMSFFCIGRN